MHSIIKMVTQFVSTVSEKCNVKIEVDKVDAKCQFVEFFYVLFIYCSMEQ